MILQYSMVLFWKITAHNSNQTWFVKKLAEIAAKVAAPPKTFLRVFFGVLIVSSAVDPKTVSMCID